MNAVLKCKEIYLTGYKQLGSVIFGCRLLVFVQVREMSGKALPVFHAILKYFTSSIFTPLKINL